MTCNRLNTILRLRKGLLLIVKWHAWKMADGGYVIYRLIAGMTILIILSIFVFPIPVISEADELTLTEQWFLKTHMPQKISEARGVLIKYRAIVGTNPAAAVNGEIFKAGQFPRFTDCYSSNDADTVKDISYEWNTAICREFAAINKKAESIQAILKDDSFSTFSLDYLKVLSELSDIRGSLNNIESALSRIEIMIADRIDELQKLRKAARQAEQEAKEALKLGDDSCFIATAAYGSQTAEELNTLRCFRDKVLMQSASGRWFVSTYYNVSPPLADFIAGQEMVRTLIREFALDPIVTCLKATRSVWDISNGVLQ